MKLKRKREVLGSEVNGIIAGIQEIKRVREDVAILMNNLWHSAVTECVSSPTLRAGKLKFSRIKGLRENIWNN